MLIFCELKPYKWLNKTQISVRLPFCFVFLHWKPSTRLMMSLEISCWKQHVSKREQYRFHRAATVWFNRDWNIVDMMSLSLHVCLSVYKGFGEVTSRAGGIFAGFRRLFWEIQHLWNPKAAVLFTGWLPVQALRSVMHDPNQHLRSEIMRPLCTPSSPAPAPHPQICVSASVWGKKAVVGTIGPPLKPISCWRECVCDASKNGETVVSSNRGAKTVFTGFFRNVCVMFYWMPPPLTSYALFCYSIHFPLT